MAGRRVLFADALRRVQGGRVSKLNQPFGRRQRVGADGRDPNGAIVSISCRPGTARCVAVDNQGGQLSSEHPALPQR
jgi:hypothetical protein